MPTKEKKKEKFLSSAEVSERWDGVIAERTLDNWRQEEKGPSFVKLGDGRVVYRLSDVIAYEEANTIVPGAKRKSR